MKRALLDILACPSCRQGLDHQAHDTEGEEILSGWLRCAGCGVVTPIVEGFPLFTEPKLHAGLAGPAEIAALAARLFGTDADYRAYIALKQARGALEEYAAFGPFNEAVRSTEPLHRVFETHLAPGDYILDAWCRTGWTGEMLASRFPAQRVVALWEGDNSVLGYRGFRYWLNHRRRSPNLDVVFADPARGLPFKAGAFGALQGLDALHRYPLVPFAGDCLRVVRRDGALAFPHVHLTNSEPDPWFDRGCRQDHGRDYRVWLDLVLAGDGRQGQVMSEPYLFHNRRGSPVADMPDTADYNGAVLIADPARGAAAPPPTGGLAPGSRLLLNPLFRLSLQRMTARIDDGWRGGVVGYYLDRHPLYRRCLPSQPMVLDVEDLAALGLIAAGATTGEIASALNLPFAELAARLDRHLAADLVLPVVASEAAVEMQRFHANQLPPPGDDAPLGLLARAAGDDGAPAGTERLEAVGVLAGVLASQGLKAGDRLALSGLAPEPALLLTFAGLALGAEVALTEGAWRGPAPALLCHAAASPPHPDHAAVALPFDGEGPRSVLALAADAEPLTDLCAGGGGVTFDLGEGTLRLPAARLAGMAYGLRASADGWFGPIGQIDRPLNLLAALVSLAQGEDLRLED
jgi:uncharacterized protein YbaR (Trm112 family)